MTAKYGERTYDASYTLDRPKTRGKKSRAGARTRASARKGAPRKVSQTQRTPAFTVALITGLVSTVGFFLVAMLAMYGG